MARGTGGSRQQKDMNNMNAQTTRHWCACALEVDTLELAELRGRTGELIGDGPFLFVPLGRGDGRVKETGVLSVFRRGQASAARGRCRLADVLGGLYETVTRILRRMDRSRSCSRFFVRSRGAAGRLAFNGFSALAHDGGYADRRRRHDRGLLHLHHGDFPVLDCQQCTVSVSRAVGRLGWTGVHRR